VFGDLPGRWTIAGAAVIVAANLALVTIDRRRPRPTVAS
jgi:hypothetical protein